MKQSRIVMGLLLCASLAGMTSCSSEKEQEFKCEKLGVSFTGMSSWQASDAEGQYVVTGDGIEVTVLPAPKPFGPRPDGPRPEGDSACAGHHHGPEGDTCHGPKGPKPEGECHGPHGPKGPEGDTCHGPKGPRPEGPCPDSCKGPKGPCPEGDSCHGPRPEGPHGCPMKAMFDKLGVDSASVKVEGEGPAKQMTAKTADGQNVIVKEVPGAMVIVKYTDAKADQAKKVVETLKAEMPQGPQGPEGPHGPKGPEGPHGGPQGPAPEGPQGPAPEQK